MARNLVLGFALALGGGVLLDRGVKDFQDATGSGSSGSSSGSSTGTPSTSVVTSTGGANTNYPGLLTTPSTNTGKIKSGLLSANQAAFAQRLQQDTGLDINVITAWLLSEEPATIATNSPRGNNNWLNVGITGSGSYGYTNPVWANPITAADATAHWLAGSPIGADAYTATDYPGASSGIRAVLGTVKQGPSAQVLALQNSGWASSGYPLLGEKYNEVLTAK